MNIEEILYELKTMDLDQPGILPKEARAIQESIPIIARCEKYRKALDEIMSDANLQDYPESFASIIKIIVKATDCEES